MPDEKLPVKTASDLEKNVTKDKIKEIPKISGVETEKKEIKFTPITDGEIAKYWFEEYEIGKKLLAVTRIVLSATPFGKVSEIAEVFFSSTTPEGIHMPESDISIVSSIKGFLVPMLVRWLLKIGGGFLLANGISEGSVTEIVGAVLAISVGLVTSLVNQKTAINTDPKSVG